MTDWTEAELTFPEKAALLKTMLNIVEVAELLGLEPDHNDKIHSPYNESDNTPSCQLYAPDHFFCYSTGRGGDAVDLVSAVTGKTNGQSMSLLWNRSLRAGFEPGRHEAVAKPEPVDLYQTFHLPWSSNLGLDLRSPWADRLGLDPNLIDALYEDELIAFVGNDLWIPHWHPDECGDPAVRGIKTRSINGGKGSITGSQYSHGLYSSLMPIDQRHAEVCVITEGESDCWTLSWAWRPNPEVVVYALPCGAGVWREDWLQCLQPYASVLVCMDNDEAGRRARDKIVRSIGWDRASEMRVPDLFSDVRAAYVAGWRPACPR